MSVKKHKETPRLAWNYHVEANREKSEAGGYFSYLRQIAFL